MGQDETIGTSLHLIEKYGVGNDKAFAGFFGVFVKIPALFLEDGSVLLEDIISILSRFSGYSSQKDTHIRVVIGHIFIFVGIDGDLFNFREAAIE